MTLLIRLGLLAMLGAALFFGYIHFGEPKLREMALQNATPSSENAAAATATSPAITDVTVLFGEYRAVAATGRYVLVLDDKGSEMRYTDKHGKVYAYRGHYTVDGPALVIDWSMQRLDGTWTPMKKYEEQMRIASHDSLTSSHGTFDRARGRKS